MNYKNIKRITLNERFYLTKKGLDSLKDRLDQLRNEKITTCRRLVNMDNKEKEEYITSTNAVNVLEMLDFEVSKIAEILQRADVITKNKKHSDIEIGSTVFLESDYRKTKYTLVNSIEADPSANKISEDSPLGRALIGKKQNSKISINTPRGKK
jgi:transcription elongation factor GreA